jgi:hypothetical protein
LPISGLTNNREVLMQLFAGMIAAARLLVSVAAGTVAAQVQTTGPMVSVRWVGQDGHDYVGPNNRLQPSDVQDMHLVLAGLDPKREITFVDVTTADRPGRDQWQYNAQSFAWKAEVKREKDAPTADLFLEPGHIEAPRKYHLLIRFDDGTTHELDILGRKVNRSLRMPGAALEAKWLGQDRQDRVGPGASVGPDGIQDVRIRLIGLSTKLSAKAMRVDGQGGLKWESGANPELLPNAEFWPDPKKPGEGDLFIQPDRDLKGQKLRVRVLYDNATLDAAVLVAGKYDPKLRMPEEPLPRYDELAAKAQWLGQDGQDVTGPGDVHVSLSGLSQAPSIAAAVLSDSVRGTWVYQATDGVKLALPHDDVTGALMIRAGSPRGTIDLFFPPCRDETGAALTLRLVDSGGRMSVARFSGGACDPGRRAPRPPESRIEARPGDDIAALARQYGTVNLAPGTYRLVHPLVLSKPVTLASDGKATLVFSQVAGDSPWTAAIKIHAGHTTLNGFAVRFEGPIRWDQDVSYGPAVIGTTDSRDEQHADLKVNIVLSRLDLESPSALDPNQWVEAIRLVRLTNAKCGVISGNVLRGGPIELFEGPWRIVDNEFRGTPPGTYSHGVFGGHGTYDLEIRGNRAHPVAPDGKTWRFLVLTGRSSNDHIEENTIEGLGFRDDDTIPPSNEPEIILTEAYHLTYEGGLAALSSDGRLVRIHRPQGQPAATGDVVALLTGPAAGQYRRISQAIDPQTYLVDTPIPKATTAVSIEQGFVDETFRKNRIDMRAGRKSAGMVLVGNHYGTRIVENHILGGSNALRCGACPTETPAMWGWSHAPFLKSVIQDNIFEDNAGGTILGMEHSARDVKSNTGRTYMAIVLEGNLLRWTEPFLKRLAFEEKKPVPPGLILGYVPSHDVGEFVVKAARNRLEATSGVSAAGSLLIHAAQYNGQKVQNRAFSLPASRGAGAAPFLPGSARTTPFRGSLGTPGDIHD